MLLFDGLLVGAERAGGLSVLSGGVDDWSGQGQGQGREISQRLTAAVIDCYYWAERAGGDH